LLTVNPLLSPPRGLSILTTFEWGLFNLAKKIVSVLLEKLDRKKGKTQYKKLEVIQQVIQPRIKSKSELPAGE